MEIGFLHMYKKQYRNSYKPLIYKELERKEDKTK